MTKLVVLRGLPGSGKSTKAAQLVMQGYKRVNFDDLRLSIDNGVYSKSNEDVIVNIGQIMVAQFLQAGYNTVIDNLNFNPYHIKFAKAIARDTRTEIEIIDIDTPLDICIERDLQRTQGRVGRDVIMNIYSKYFIDGKFPEVPK